MGRSVSRPRNAEVVCYQHREFEGDDWEWDNFKEDIAESCKSVWPSLDDCDEWLDREDHAILENTLVYIGLSEYCGLVSIWIVPKNFDGYDDYEPLAHHWIGQIEDRFTEMFSELVYGGSFSNGEAVFHYKDDPEHHRTSKGYDNYNI